MTNSSTAIIGVRSLGDCLIKTPKAELNPNHEILFATALFFCFNHRRKISRDSLETVLWPSLDHSGRAHHRLRQTILKLRQAGFPIVRESGFLKVNLPVLIDFEQTLAETQSNASPTTPTSFDFLPDYSPRISTEFSHWLDEKRLEVNSALVRILLDRIAFYRNRGEWATVESLARTCRQVEPYNEAALFAAAEALALRGGKLEALSMLDDYVAELGSTTPEVLLPTHLMRKRISEHREQPEYRSKETPLVGREEELSALNGLLEETQSAKGQCCLLEGDVGLGKSRIASEFSSIAHIKGIDVKFTRCHQADQSRPLSAFVDLVPRLRKLRGAIGCSPESLEILNRLSRSGHRERFSPELDDPETIAENILSSVLDLLDAVSEEKCLLIILDDAQWMDTASANLFQEISRWIETKKVMLLFMVRSPALEWPNLQKLARVKLVSLAPLSKTNASKLILLLSEQRSKTVSTDEVEEFVKRGEGNPYFLSELIGQWADSGRTDETPPSLVAITNQRLRKLSPPALQILQACTILGRYSTLTRLESVLEFRAFEFLEGLNELGKTSLIRAQSTPGESTAETSIECAHELIGLGALKLLSAPAEIAVHRRVGMTLENESLNEFSPTLIWESAFHWEKAGDAKHAFNLAKKCADHLMNIGFPTEAIKSYQKAFAFCGSDEKKAEVLRELVDALHVTGAWKELISALTELEMLNKALGLAHSHSDLELMTFEAQWRSSQHWSDLLERVKCCVFAEEASPEHRLRAAVLGLKLATNVDRVEELDRIYTAVKPFLTRSDTAREASLCVEMVYHIDRGDMDQGRNAAQALVEEHRLRGNPGTLIWSLVNGAQAMRRCGLLASAIEFLEEAFEIATKKNLRTRACTVAHHLVLTSLAKDDVVAAAHWLAVAGTFPTPAEDLHTLHERMFYGARIALANGKLSEAAALCRQIPSNDDQSLLRRISLVSLKLRLAILKKEPAEAVSSLLAELRALYDVECARGGQDFEALSLYLGQVYLGDQLAAQAQLREYVSVHRRERGELPHEITEALATMQGLGS